MRDSNAPIPKLSELDRMEQRFLVGRSQEIRLFQDRLNTDPISGGIINLHGTSGVGKSYLLNEFRRVSFLARAKFFLFDCRILPRNSHDVCLHLLNAFHYPVNRMEQTTDIDQLTEDLRRYDSILRERRQINPGPGYVRSHRRSGALAERRAAAAVDTGYSRGHIRQISHAGLLAGLSGMAAPH
ncbi:MAG: hypothetical protein JWR03_1421 [Cohnella sp.]|nr:hypothetical protein [Cohnella sp.]